jgi:hypothetical protein
MNVVRSSLGMKSNIKISYSVSTESVDTHSVLDVTIDEEHISYEYLAFPTTSWLIYSKHIGLMD